MNFKGDFFLGHPVILLFFVSSSHFHCSAQCRSCQQLSPQAYCCQRPDSVIRSQCVATKKNEKQTNNETAVSTHKQSLKLCQQMRNKQTQRQTNKQSNAETNKHQNRDIKRTNIVVVYLIYKTALEIQVCIFRRIRNGYPMSHVSRSEYEDLLLKLAQLKVSIFSFSGLLLMPICYSLSSL